MAIHPLVYTEKVVQSFLRYQLTAYPFADPHLHARMRELLSLEAVRRSPLLQGPYISLSRAFQGGASVEDLVAAGVFHPHMQQLIPFPALYEHQEKAVRAIMEGRTTLVSTGTGSGKSECFLYPIVSRCLSLRDEGAHPGISAVIVYPMNALAEDQLGRLRELLAGSGITFGMYVGKTPQNESGVSGIRLKPGATNAQYQAALEAERMQGTGQAVHPAEEVCSRELMRTAGRQPRILLTNVKQLELLLTRQSDVELFDEARLDFLVFDEAHTFTGAQGAEAACLVRRLRNYCERGPEDTVCVATSATIVDEGDPDAARKFASRFFGVAADAVETVHEAYEPEDWATSRSVPDPPADPATILQQTLGAIDAAEPDREVRSVWRSLTGADLPAGAWEAALHEVLGRNELLFQAAQALEVPRRLDELLEEVGEVVGRPVTEEELVLWLTLGAAARAEGRPLVRPVVHGFLRGVGGAVVSFPEGGAEPHLWLSAEDEPHEEGLTLPVSSCTTCGQHYFAHSLGDFSFTEREPGGGTAQDGEVYWEAVDEAHGGTRAMLIDRRIANEEDDDDAERDDLHPLHLCAECGSAHREEGDRCLQCGVAAQRIRLLAVRQREESKGKLHRCVSCSATGRRSYTGYREPARPVRATNVADVHVLAQDMVHHADRKRLLVFADNRQDAAFQAGWMQDHARRFRLRSLMADVLDREPEPIGVGDLVHELGGRLEAEPSLSRALIPEVWAVAPSSGRVHREERETFLRILVLREVATGARQRLGLEPWGRLRIDYKGLHPAHSFFQRWGTELGLEPSQLCEGVMGLLDQLRRRRLVHDPVTEIFSRFRGPGDRDLENGYLPPMSDVPKGMKLTREGGDDKGRIAQWISPTGHRTSAREIASKWGVPNDRAHDFLEELWRHLSLEVPLIVPRTLKGQRGNALPGCGGAHQLDGEQLMLATHRGVYRCRLCRRLTIRTGPHDKCLGWHCEGELEAVIEDPDNYDLQLLDQDYTLLRPREHTAMVPNAEREKIEQKFKGPTDEINALVCTQTLEMGVDIGALDAILLRNVPPLPANYWQRVGRAGRRHRMAVNLTYCRTTSHDRAYYLSPEKMLGGRIDPPAFHLSNEHMVAKHVHATVISKLHQLGRPLLLEKDREHGIQFDGSIMHPPSAKLWG